MINALARGGINEFRYDLKLLSCTFLVPSVRRVKKFLDAGTHFTTNGAVRCPPFFTLSVSFGCRALTYQRNGPPSSNW